MEAVVACELLEELNPALEQMSAIRHIKAASEHITKQSFGSAKTPRKAYVNPLGQSILSELDSLRVELQKQGEILQSMEPLRETAVAIRRRFYHNSSNITERGMGRHGVEPITGNAAAREGNVVTDTIMISRGELPYPNTFHRLYGIEHTIASAYFDSPTLIKILNKRATMLANPTRYRWAWREKDQKDFETILEFYTNANSVERVEFESRDVARLPATEARRCLLLRPRLQLFGRPARKPM